MKNRLLFFVILISLFSIGCKIRPDEQSDITNNVFPIRGKYTVINKFNQNGEKIRFQNKNMIFYKDRAFISGKDYTNVRYMTKMVNLKDYLVNNYNLNNMREYDRQDDIVVLSVYSGEDFVCDIAIMEDTKILVNENYSLYEAQYDGKIDENDYNFIVSKRKIERNAEPSETFKPTALFLGLRDDDGEEPSYYTFFVYRDSAGVQVYKTEGIYLPKNTGYLNIDIKKEPVGGVLTNPITATFKKHFEDFDTNVSANLESDKTKFYGKKKIKINYVNPQFLSYTYETLNYGREDFKDSISILPIESSSVKSPITLDQVYQKDSLEVIKDDINNVLYSELYFDKRNMGIIRRNGYWVMIVRMFDNTDGVIKNVDISLRDVNAGILLNEDKQSISIKDINNLFSNVRDFTTSSIRNLAVVKTTNSFKIVNFKNVHLDVSDILTIETKDASMYMNMWSYGSEAESHFSNVKKSEMWHRFF